MQEQTTVMEATISSLKLLVVMSLGFRMRLDSNTYNFFNFSVVKSHLYLFGPNCATIYDFPKSHFLCFLRVEIFNLSKKSPAQLSRNKHYKLKQAHLLMRI